MHFFGNSWGVHVLPCTPPKYATVLEMVMRREHETELEAAFRPAEWRWMLPETCDDRWHHYAIVFANADQVSYWQKGCIKPDIGSG